jgi:DNA-nicking Smr family endonuclease
MTGSRGRSGKSGRTVQPDEAELWSRVAGSVDKVKAKPRVPSHSDEVPTAPAASTKAPPESSHKPRLPRAPAIPLPPSRPSPLKPLAEYDRRAARQVASGKAQIDARLDLHGMRQRDARIELHAFLRTAQARGHRTVLVITGKGDPGAEPDHLARAFGKPQRGVLRHSVPQWLEEPEMRSVVLSYISAGVRHGGEGALYVQLRKLVRS